jgi:hypothetical protein
VGNQKFLEAKAQRFAVKSGLGGNESVSVAGFGGEREGGGEAVKRIFII